MGGSWCGPFKIWARIYDYDITFNLTNSEAALVIGVEVSLWSEQADATVLDSRLWPRTAALVESLWSGNKDSNGKKRYAQAIDKLND
jgi:hexosaminidase